MDVEFIKHAPYGSYLNIALVSVIAKFQSEGAIFSSSPAVEEEERIG